MYSSTFVAIVVLFCQYSSLCFPKLISPHLSVSCSQFQPEGGKMIVSSFSDPISLICPPRVRQALVSQWRYDTGAACRLRHQPEKVMCICEWQLNLTNTS